MPESQQELFEPTNTSWPDGFRYQPRLIGEDDERELVALIKALSFTPFQFHGFEGKRRVVSFGWRYDFDGGGLQPADAIPDFLIPLRAAAARFADREPTAFQHAMVTEYAPGAAIGWHKDRAVFADVIGLSLVSPCTFRFRCKAGTSWKRHALTLDPRSVYLLRGPSRKQWEHSIPPVRMLRYSVTFRSLHTEHKSHAFVDSGRVTSAQPAAVLLSPAGYDRSAHVPRPFPT
jgi:alkylated DNA repair dioxygenase AlkB